MKNFNPELWLDLIQNKIENEFNDNLLYIGYHGSYRRLEADETSDIDLIVILKKLTINELKQYKKIIETMPFKKKCCGFISGETEIKNWSKPDLFQFYHETKNIYGDIKAIISPPSIQDLQTSVKTGVETLYHQTCHSFLYQNNHNTCLINLYKMAFYILQAKYFLQTNKYILTKKELLKNLDNQDYKILQTCINRNSIKNYSKEQIEQSYKELIDWCQNNMTLN